MMSPYAIRQSMGGMDLEEREAFEYCLSHVRRSKPSLNISEAIDECIDIGLFSLGKEGELRVNKDAFNGKVN